LGASLQTYWIIISGAGPRELCETLISRSFELQWSVDDTEQCNYQSVVLASGGWWQPSWGWWWIGQISSWSVILQPSLAKFALCLVFKLFLG
jgi:hypothetical protein